jgi:hypothetical protein
MRVIKQENRVKDDEIIELALSKLKLPWKFLHLPALKYFSYRREFGPSNERERYSLDFGTHEVPLEDMPSDSYAGPASLTYNYSTYFSLEEVSVHVHFNVIYEYTYEDKELLRDLDKLQTSYEEYTTIMC